MALRIYADQIACPLWPLCLLCDCEIFTNLHLKLKLKLKLFHGTNVQFLSGPGYDEERSRHTPPRPRDTESSFCGDQVTQTVLGRS